MCASAARRPTPSGDRDGGHAGGGVGGVAGPEAQPHRLHAGPGRASRATVHVDRGLQTRPDHHVAGGLDAGHVDDRGGVGEGRAAAVDPAVLPIEQGQEGASRSGGVVADGVPGPFADRDQGHPRRPREALLGPCDAEVEPPPVDVELLAREGGHGVGQHQGAVGPHDLGDLAQGVEDCRTGSRSGPPPPGRSRGGPRARAPRPRPGRPRRREPPPRRGSRRTRPARCRTTWRTRRTRG